MVRTILTIDLLRPAIYARALLANSRVREYLDQHQPDIVARFETIIADARGYRRISQVSNPLGTGVAKQGARFTVTLDGEYGIVGARITRFRIWGA